MKESRSRGRSAFHVLRFAIAVGAAHATHAMENNPQEMPCARMFQCPLGANFGLLRGMSVITSIRKNPHTCVVILSDVTGENLRGNIRNLVPSTTRPGKITGATPRVILERKLLKRRIPDPGSFAALRMTQNPF